VILYRIGVAMAPAAITRASVVFTASRLPTLSASSARGVIVHGSMGIVARCPHSVFEQLPRLDPSGSLSAWI
jgi:hypothetical protein